MSTKKIKFDSNFSKTVYYIRNEKRFLKKKNPTRTEKAFELSEEQTAFGKY